MSMVSGEIFALMVMTSWGSDYSFFTERHDSIGDMFILI